jgi:hypothetical protein
MKVFLREVISEYIASVLRRMDKGDQKVQRKCASLKEMASLSLVQSNQPSKRSCMGREEREKSTSGYFKQVQLIRC